jgi:hypothetical protein
LSQHKVISDNMASIAVKVAGAKFIRDFGSIVAFGDFPSQACCGSGDQGMDGPDVRDAL